MAMEFKRRLPIPMEIREEMPLSAELTAKKQAFDAEVAKVFTGEDARKVLIIGPCSADREDSVLEYMNRLAKTAEEVKDKLIIIPRVYTNKPRTKAPVTRVFCTTPTPRLPTTCSRASRQSAICTYALLRRPVSSPPTRCSIRPTTSTSLTC
mgnify:CR=1 FL=1